MILQHINVKIYVDRSPAKDLEPLIPLFHQWIAEQVAEELLIDVADYRHVPEGPGVVLVGLEADYSLDETDGISGLRYNAKNARQGSNADRLRQSLQRALWACERIEQQMPALQFDRRRFEVFVNDRALAPNTVESRDKADLPALLAEVLGTDQFRLQYNDDPRRLFGARVEQQAEMSALAK